MNLDGGQGDLRRRRPGAPRARPAGPRAADHLRRPTGPGHDARYAIDDTKARGELGWAPRRSFEQGLEETVRWYLEHQAWWEPIRAGRYAGVRLGLGEAAVAHGA